MCATLWPNPINIRTAVDAIVKGARLGEPAYYDDGTCEIDAEVTVAKLVSEIKRIHTEDYKGRSVTTTDIEHIKDHIKTDVIRVTGSGALLPAVPARSSSGRGRCDHAAAGRLFAAEIHAGSGDLGRTCRRKVD